MKNQFVGLDKTYLKVHGAQVSKIFPHKNTCTALEKHRTFTDEKRLEAKTSALIC